MQAKRFFSVPALFFYVILSSVKVYQAEDEEVKADGVVEENTQ